MIKKRILNKRTNIDNEDISIDIISNNQLKKDLNLSTISFNNVIEQNFKKNLKSFEIKISPLKNINEKRTINSDKHLIKRSGKIKIQTNYNPLNNFIQNNLLISQDLKINNYSSTPKIKSSNKFYHFNQSEIFKAKNFYPEKQINFRNSKNKKKQNLLETYCKTYNQMENEFEHPKNNTLLNKKYYIFNNFNKLENGDYFHINKEDNFNHYNFKSHNRISKSVTLKIKLYNKESQKNNFNYILSNFFHISTNNKIIDKKFSSNIYSNTRKLTMDDFHCSERKFYNKLELKNNPFFVKTIEKCKNNNFDFSKNDSEINENSNLKTNFKSFFSDIKSSSISTTNKKFEKENINFSPLANINNCSESSKNSLDSKKSSIGNNSFFEKINEINRFNQKNLFINENNTKVKLLKINNVKSERNSIESIKNSKIKIRTNFFEFKFSYNKLNNINSEITINQSFIEKEELNISNTFHNGSNHFKFQDLQPRSVEQIFYFSQYKDTNNSKDLSISLENDEILNENNSENNDDRENMVQLFPSDNKLMNNIQEERNEYNTEIIFDKKSNNPTNYIINNDENINNLEITNNENLIQLENKLNNNYNNQIISNNFINIHDNSNIFYYNSNMNPQLNLFDSNSLYPNNNTNLTNLYDTNTFINSLSFQNNIPRIDYNFMSQTSNNNLVYFPNSQIISKSNSFEYSNNLTNSSFLQSIITNNFANSLYHSNINSDNSYNNSSSYNDNTTKQNTLAKSTESINPELFPYFFNHPQLPPGKENNEIFKICLANSLKNVKLPKYNSEFQRKRTHSEMNNLHVYSFRNNNENTDNNIMNESDGRKVILQNKKKDSDRFKICEEESSVNLPGIRESEFKKYRKVNSCKKNYNSFISFYGRNQERIYFKIYRDSDLGIDKNYNKILKIHVRIFFFNFIRRLIMMSIRMKSN